MGKNIVFLFDGTGNRVGAVERTNIVDMFQGLEQSNDQIVYYDTGVGTASGARHPWIDKVAKTLKKALGKGVQKNVAQAYQFLMDNYADGDRVYLLGFSRGAYTARVFAGLVKKIGLLKPGNFQLVEPALGLYFREAPDDDVAAFKRIATRKCDIRFVGVFDTVASMGFLYSMKFFKDSTLHPEIPRGVHAVAIDERRKKFLPNLWSIPEDQLGTRVEQVWFAGVHSDVGGWYEDRGLSAIALQWMLKHARKAGLTVPASFLAEIGARADAEGKQHESYTGLWKYPGGEQRRTLPKGARVHESVKQRRASMAPRYDPPNLPADDDLIYVSDPDPAPGTDED